MLSAGNDIVAFSEIDVARTNTPRFYTKILSEPEIALYEQFSAQILFEHYVWLLWSIKESAYKFLKRLNLELVFTPVKFEVKHLRISAGYSIVSFEEKEKPTTLKGLITFGKNRLYSKTEIYKEFIFSVVDNDENFEGVCSNIKQIEATDNVVQSSAVRSFLIEELTQQTGTSNLTIEKNPEGIPFLLEGLEKLPIPISLSHHGHYISFSFRL